MMIYGNKVTDNIVYHCPNCCGAFEFDVSPLLLEGNIHDIICPYCNCIVTLDITDPYLPHRYVSLLDKF